MDAYQKTGFKTKKDVKGKSRREIQVQETRKRILEAGRRIFTSYPYSDASLRMIGDAGGFTHSFIRYHYKTKTNLFEAVIHYLFKEYLEKGRGFIQAAAKKKLKHGLTGFVNDFVESGFKHPDLFRIVMLNIGEENHIGEILNGLQHMNDTLIQLFKTNIAIDAKKRESEMWFSGFTLLLTVYIGCASVYTNSLGMTNDKRQYIAFVKKSLTFIFYPALKALIFPESYNTKRVTIKSTVKVKSIPDEIKIVEEPPRTIKGDRSRKRILKAARQIFVQNPYNKATIRQIGDMGDIDFTLFYNYLESINIAFPSAF